MNSIDWPQEPKSGKINNPHRWAAGAESSFSKARRTSSQMQTPAFSARRGASLA
jgi:hypothetical protein